MSVKEQLSGTKVERYDMTQITAKTRIDWALKHGNPSGPTSELHFSNKMLG